MGNSAVGTVPMVVPIVFMLVLVLAFVYTVRLVATHPACAPVVAAGLKVIAAVVAAISGLL